MSDPNKRQQFTAKEGAIILLALCGGLSMVILSIAALIAIVT